MSHRPTIALLAGLRRAFCDLRSVSELCTLLHTEHDQLLRVALRPWYHIFRVPKRSGKLRVIEDPRDDLQAIQATLNDYLQAVYWHQRSPAAYGFLIVPADDPEPRHIETNAAQHLNRPWLLNADLENFFHQVSTEMVQAVFKRPPFDFGEELATVLTRLVTFRGRLPMGAPTSPVLSNLAFQPVDADLLDFARRRGWIYTRYADDMSFSSHEPISWNDYAPLRRICERRGFPFNAAKAMLFDDDDTKIITGLQLAPGRVVVPDSFYPQIYKDIRNLAGALTVQQLAGAHYSRANERFRRSVEGKIRFAERIMGSEHPFVQKARREYRKATTPPNLDEVRSWLDFPYF